MVPEESSNLELNHYRIGNICVFTFTSNKLLNKIKQSLLRKRGLSAEINWGLIVKRNTKGQP